MTDRYQGDPKLTLDENGADLTFKGGQPVMDQGIENAAMISLFTEPNWCGNIFFQDPNEKIGSQYLEKARQPITLASLNDTRSAAENALSWMTRSGIASKIAAVVNNPRTNWLQSVILIQPPGRDLDILLVKKNGSNWISQKLDPAYLKV